MPVVFELWLTGGVNFDAVIASVCIWRLGELCQDSQLVGDGSHCGPCFHRVDDFSCVEVKHDERQMHCFFSHL